MKLKHSLQEAILEAMPFSSELLEWCKLHPEFMDALKNVYADKFISLGAVATSYSPNFPSDQVIGIYTYAYRMKNPKFKQDFIVNKSGLNQEFFLYTRNAGADSTKYVKDINEFFKTYGAGGHYKKTHHVSLRELPEELKERGKRVISLAERIKHADLSQIPENHIKDIHRKIKAAKSNKR